MLTRRTSEPVVELLDIEGSKDGQVCTAERHVLRSKGSNASLGSTPTVCTFASGASGSTAASSLPASAASLGSSLSFQASCSSSWPSKEREDCLSLDDYFGTSPLSSTSKFSAYEEVVLRNCPDPGWTLRIGPGEEPTPALRLRLQIAQDPDRASQATAYYRSESPLDPHVLSPICCDAPDLPSSEEAGSFASPRVAHSLNLACGAREVRLNIEACDLSDTRTLVTRRTTSRHGNASPSHEDFAVVELPTLGNRNAF